MKTLFILLISFLTAGTAFAQTGEVTINVKGNRITQIAVDNQYYNVSNSSSTGQKVLTLNTLSTGQHSLEIVRRSNSYNATTNSVNTTFTLRPGYDLTINIANNGSVSLTEKRSIANSSGTAITTAVYNRIYSQTKKRTSSTARATYLQNEFSNSNRMFTSRQASTLIQLVNSESRRFELAKQSYTRVVDRENFSLVSALLNSTANRNALNEYINTIPGVDNNTGVENSSTPMTSQRFQVIYNEVMAESGNTNKNYYLSNFFNKTYNFYTSVQARQLIQLVTTEAERFYLAKVAYRGITDRTNYYNQVYPLLNTYNRSELATYINTYNNNGSSTSGTVMSDAAFTTLYNNVNSSWSAASKFSLETDAFASNTNYFSTYQVRQLLQLISSETDRLTLAKSAYDNVVDKSNFSQVYDLFSTSSRRNELMVYVNSYNNNGGVVSGTVMTDAAFSTLYNNVSSSWSASGKFNLETEAFNNTYNYFSTYQVRQLLQLISSETDRLTLAKNAYENVVDQSNFSQVYDLFSSTANRNELIRYVNSGVGVGVVRSPMTDAEFNSTLRDVQYTFGLGAKMSSLTKIFSNDAYYFTAQQAKKLIELVSLESNRLDLAKLAYNNLTDPANYAVIKDLFSSQSSKDQLDAYVSANAYLNN